MTTIQPGSAGPPPGWYQDPTTGTDRYWNGRHWTEHVRGGTDSVQPPPPARDDRAPTSYVVVGYVCAVLLPIAGLIMGIVLMVRNRVNDGAGCIVLSLIMGAIWVGLLTG